MIVAVFELLVGIAAVVGALTLPPHGESYWALFAAAGCFLVASKLREIRERFLQGLQDRHRLWQQDAAGNVSVFDWSDRTD